MSLDDITLAVDYFDLKKIAESGQCFRWKELGPGKYLIPSGQTCAIMEQKEPDDDLHLLIEEGTLPLWQDYLNYGERYGSIIREAREATLADGSPDLFLREAVDVVEGAAQYMSETTPMEHWSDKMLDLLLNGPTINGIKKDEVRALLRQTYAALKHYEVIGPMASPFMNDPTAIVALAFRELYPRLEDEEGKPAYGLTIFPDDGSTPIVCISAEVPTSAGPELLAHELAHVAAGEAVEHGPEWKAAEEAIFQKYNEILDAKIPDEPVEVAVTPHEVGDGGILAMPLKANIPDPQRDDWKLVTCPICGAECWENDLARQAMAAEPELRAACTTCALKAGVAAGGKH